MNALEHAISSLNKLVNAHVRDNELTWAQWAQVELAAYLEVRDSKPANYAPYAGDGHILALYQNARKTAESLAMGGKR